ncbi:MAG: protein BatD [Verrucomicrobia bacterium]|nr:protein BatD [Verrucomicrobiota bacterium]
MFTLAVFWSGTIRVPGIGFSASLDRNTVLVGETVALTLQFEGGGPRTMPVFPQVPGLQVGPGSATSINTTRDLDGNATTIHTYTINLIASQAGDFVIPAITAEVGGQRLTSQPLPVTVRQSDPVAPPEQLADQMAFLWLNLPKPEIHVGEVVVAELRLYVRSGVGNVSDLQLPPLNGEGYNAGQVVPGKQYQRRVGNTPFSVVPFQFTLMPVKGGLLTIGPATGSVVALFGPTDFFGRHTQRRQLQLSLERQTFQAISLPAQNVPRDFNGAVGNYTLTVNAGPTNVATGDPITVRIQIAGRGALQALTLPEQSAWRDFKIYPPTAAVETSDPLGVQGKKTFEQIVSPQSTDIKELPPFSFSFFDPDAKVYRTLTQPAMKLLVRPGGTAPAPVIAAGGASMGDNPPPPRDIVPIKPHLGSVASAGAPLLQQPWFLALQCVPLLAWLGALGWRKRADALANNPRKRRERQVAQVVREGMDNLRRLAASKNSDDFFAVLFRLLQEQLGERLDCPASSITEAVIDEKLRARGIPESTAATLHELFQTCNLARYAPVKSTQELTALIGKLETALREVRGIKP